MNAVASHPRGVQQLWRRQNSAPDLQRVDLDAYQDLNGDRRVKPLQTQLADQQQGAAVHRVQIRQLREEVQRGTRRRFIRPTSSHPDHDIS